jgi:hypothetical protein
MKYLLAACAAALALSASAFAEEAAAPAQQPELPAAQASTCPTFTMPADPTLPDGATANANAMQQGNATYQSWIQTVRSGYDCRRNEYRQALANLRAREAELRPMNDKVQTITTGWEAQVNAYNARTGRARR